MKKEKEKKKFTWLGHFCSFAMFHMDGLWILDLGLEFRVGVKPITGFVNGKDGTPTKELLKLGKPFNHLGHNL